MIIALDIETIPNKDVIHLLPEPKLCSRLKDPVKIEKAKIDGKAKQLEKMALDPLTARVACFALVGVLGNSGYKESVQVIKTIDDDSERFLIQSILKTLGWEGTRIATWNGIGFDLPMIYKRAMCLGVDPANFDAPPLPAWTKRYNTDRHFDLMKIWCGWGNDYAKLDDVSRLVLDDHKTADFDVTAIAGMLESEEGKAAVGEYCLQDTRLTWNLWERFNGTLFV